MPLPWVSEKKANHSTPVPFACLQMGAEKPSRGALRLRSSMEPARASRLPRKQHHFPTLSPLYKNMLMVSSHCTRTERESKNECGIQIEAAPLQLQIVLHSTHVSRGHTPPVPWLLQVGWIPETFIHTGSLGKKKKKTTPLSVSYVRIIFHESRWFVLIWIVQCLIFIFYQKKVAPYLQLLLGLSRVLKASNGNIYALSVKER